MIKECLNCGNKYEYERFVCPKCGSDIANSSLSVEDAQRALEIQNIQHESDRFANLGSSQVKRADVYDATRYRKDLERAKEYFTKAIELNKFNPEAHAGLGFVMYALGENDKAIVSLKESVKLNPKRENTKALLKEIKKPGCLVTLIAFLLISVTIIYLSVAFM